MLKSTPKSKSPVKKVAGRKAKHSNKISDEDMSNMDQGITTPKEVADKNQIPVQSVHNKRHREKLKLSFKSKQADPSVTSESNQPNIISPEQQSPQEANQGGNIIPLDATEALKGIWTFADTILFMVAHLSKGQIEYTKLDSTEIESLATVCNQSPFMRKLATQEGLSALIIAGTIISVFSGHIKFNFTSKKHKKDDANCKCDDCRKLKILEKELKQAEFDESKKKELINNVPIVSVDEVPNLLNPDKPTDEILRDRIKSSSSLNETGEYTLPPD
jgi:hypothetical protein